MAKFRDLRGNFFSIPEEILEQYRILPEELPARLKTEQVSGTEVGEANPSRPARESSPPRIIINQFFTPVKDPNMQPEGHNDFAAQYTYPNA
ncbi:MAG: hypothetical protein AAGU11_21860, partial [Syntrophobacteraceae bacterium]